MRSFRIDFAICLSLAVAVCLPAELAAQAVSGDLVGIVSDESGAAVPNASVTVTNEATGVVASASAGASGQYRFSNLLAGLYTIAVKSSGFTDTTLKGVLVSINKTATANLTLRIGAVSTAVDVTEAAAVIDTTTATVGSTYDSRAARDLPVSSIGLGTLNLSLLSAGVASNGGLGAGEGPSVGGQRPYNNNFTIEGVDNNNKSVTGALLRFVPNDAVAEFTLQQNQFSAEFGHSTGGQFNTTMKSGTNSMHGSLYEYLQNKKLNAVDQVFANQGITSNTRFDSNRVGGNFGGPVIRNRLFYFGNFEYNPTGRAATTGGATFTPTSDGYAKLAALPGINKTNLAQFQQHTPVASAPIPDTSQFPVVNGTAIPVGILPLASPAWQNGYYSVLSADYSHSPRDQIRGRYIFNKLVNIDTTAQFPEFYGIRPTTYYVASIAEYHNFSPYLMNELRVGYNRFNDNIPAGNFKFPGLDAFPTLIFDELNVQLGPNPQAPQFTVQNTYQLNDNLSWYKGRHSLRFGVEGRKYISPQSFTQRSRGEYEYSTLEQYLNDLTPDATAQRGLGNVVYYGDQVAVYSYVNDTIRIRPNLSLSMGLRHEYTTVPVTQRLQSLNSIANAPGLIEFFEPKAQRANFAPRLGLAYSPGKNGRTSLRAGFGMGHDVLYDNIGILQLPPQLKSTVDVSGEGKPDFLRNGGIRGDVQAGTLNQADARAATAAFLPHQRVPYSMQWNFGIQRVFLTDYTFEARYLGTRGVRLNVQTRINKIAPVMFAQNLPTYLQAPSQSTLDALPLTLASLRARSNIKPDFEAAGFTNGAFVVDSPVGNSIYHGLALQLNRRFSRGFQMVAAYTWSHNIDDSTADFFTTVLTPRRPQDFQNLRPERSRSALDRRQRLTLSAVYDLPKFSSLQPWMRRVASGWTIAPIYTYESPEFVTVQSALDSNLNGDTWADRTIVNPGGRDGVGSGVTPLLNSAGATVAYLARDPGARYIRAGAGAYANGGRNTLAGRPINNWDLNILRNIAVTEKLRVQFSAQLLNAFNHAQFVPGFVNRVDNPVILNTGSAVRNYLTPGNAIFNNPEAIYTSNPRTVQLALKLIF